MFFKIAAPVLLAASALAQTFSVSTPVRPDQPGLISSWWRQELTRLGLASSMPCVHTATKTD